MTGIIKKNNNMQTDITMRLTKKLWQHFRFRLGKEVENCIVLTAQGIVSIMDPFKHAESSKCFNDFIKKTDTKDHF